MKTLATLILITLSAVFGSLEAKDRTYRGEYFYNFENSIFTPNGQKEAWCLGGISMEKAELPTENSGGPWGTSDVILRGKLGPEGSYGSLGRCKRVLTVTEIVEVTNMRDRDGKAAP